LRGKGNVLHENRFEYKWFLCYAGGKTGMYCEFERNCLNGCNVNTEGASVAVMAAAGLVNMRRLQDTCVRHRHEQNGCDYDYAMNLLHKFFPVSESLLG
jgi:hypothetical protein